MSSFLEALSHSGSAGIPINLLFKGALILCFAALLNLALRRASAAARHWIWCLAFGGLLLLLPMSIWLPQKPVPILPGSSGLIALVAAAARGAFPARLKGIFPIIPIFMVFGGGRWAWFHSGHPERLPERG